VRDANAPGSPSGGRAHTRRFGAPCNEPRRREPPRCQQAGNPLAMGSQDRLLSQRPSVCKDGRAVPVSNSVSEIDASRHGQTVLEHQATRHPRDVGRNQRHRGTQAVASHQATGGRRTVCSRVCGCASSQGRCVGVDATVNRQVRARDPMLRCAVRHALRSVCRDLNVRVALCAQPLAALQTAAGFVMASPPCAEKRCDCRCRR